MLNNLFVSVNSFRYQQLEIDHAAVALDAMAQNTSV
jgi:hypothetical protein